MKDGFRSECKQCYKIISIKNYKYEKVPAEKRYVAKYDAKEYYKKNKDKILEQGKINKRRYRENPTHKVQDNISRSIRKKIKNFHPDVSRIKEHLENQFTNELTWDNYGTVWHVEHIVPQSLYDFSNKEDINRCWNERNLRPLKAIDNLRKNNKLNAGLIEEYGIKDLLPVSMEI
jgi:hypothetical protein